MKRNKDTHGCWSTLKTGDIIIDTGNVVEGKVLENMKTIFLISRFDNFEKPDQWLKKDVVKNYGWRIKSSHK